MFTVLKNVIESKKYELRDMLNKLDVFWAQGDITKEERDELITLAQNKANVVNGINVIAKLEELDKRVKEVEQAIAKNAEQDGESDESATYPEYIIGDWYRCGDKITFEGKNYICVAPEGQICTWNPVEYPPYWDMITTE